MRGLAGGKRANRKGHLDESRKKEFTAYRKLKITEDTNEKIKQGFLQDQGEKKFWPSGAKKLGINSEIKRHHGQARHAGTFGDQASSRHQRKEDEQEGQ